MPISQKSDIDRFLEKIDFNSSPHGCWLWTAGSQYGYGIFFFKGKSVKAHRFAWEHWNQKPIPEGFCIDHFIMNKFITRSFCSTRCVNPSHLKVVLNKENSPASEIQRAAVSKVGKLYSSNLNSNKKSNLPEGLTYKHGKKYIQSQIYISGLGHKYLGSRKASPEAIIELSNIYQKEKETRDANCQ